MNLLGKIHSIQAGDIGRDLDSQVGPVVFPPRGAQSCGVTLSQREALLVDLAQVVGVSVLGELFQLLAH